MCKQSGRASDPNTRVGLTMVQAHNRRAIRGIVVHCLHDPGEGDNADAVEIVEDGLLVIEQGLVACVGPAADLLPQLEDSIEIEDQRGRFILPGFIDTHIHYAQTDMIASYGEQLLSWLNRYVFPTEGRFGDKEVADETARFFINELLRNGTTSALVMGTVHRQSAESVFQQAYARDMRMVAGKVLMDRNAPDYLLDTPDSGFRDTRDLIERWHGTDRLSYAITPRFAPSSSDEQLQRAGELAHQYPDTYIHTHVAENLDEVEWVKSLFPWSRSYLDVYDRFGLLRERSVYAHSIHLDDLDRRRMTESGAVAVFCPTSNMFLGSGLFDHDRTHQQRVAMALATDVGAGTSFSMLRTVSEAYKVGQLNGSSVAPLRLLYLATLAGAEALDIDDRVGSFRRGREADFVVLDPQATPLLARRTAYADTMQEKLFALFMLGDDRHVRATWLRGQPALQKDES